MNKSTTLFDRLLSSKRPLWVRLAVSLALLSLPFFAAWMDGLVVDILQEGYWRSLLSPMAVIIYIWLVAQHMARLEVNVVDALRSLAEIDEGEFDRLVAEASHIPLMHELSVLGVGLVLGIFSAASSDFDNQAPWLQAYWFISSAAFYGLLAWTIYIAIAGTRQNATLHRLPLRFDILDTSPFEVVGRQSLLIALVFVGGITLSFLLVVQVESFASPTFWILYLLLVLLTVVIFFLNMLPTHQVMAAEKKRQLETVERHIKTAFQTLTARIEEGQEAGDLAGQINALSIYEKRLEGVTSWPYNTNMLRTLFFSVFLPLGSVLGRMIIDIFKN
jgi:hypothetical protein